MSLLSTPSLSDSPNGQCVVIHHFGSSLCPHQQQTVFNTTLRDSKGYCIPSHTSDTLSDRVTRIPVSRLWTSYVSQRSVFPFLQSPSPLSNACLRTLSITQTPVQDITYLKLHVPLTLRPFLSVSITHGYPEVLENFQTKIEYASVISLTLPVHYTV